ncbi:MAG: DUF4340 domain-containing protein [Planctomycetia bacterium]|nr:DUF4340 domain-containing protein [Planctomycetia bacterium]RLT15305.1 MAG: DUF4340 domain-containing protein [Planctomycetota bacterium]
MNEHQSPAGMSPVLGKTLIFIGVGVGLLLWGAAAQPRFTSTKPAAKLDKVLFPELSDASKAASLEIISYDDQLATLHPFKVLQTGGVWVLPSHQNYPADAKDQLAAAATSLIDLESLDIVSVSPGDHETYGVIEPDSDKIKPGMTGIGQLIEVRDTAGTKLARLIVGKEDKRPAGADGAGRSLRFVRKAGQDPVYRVEIDTSKFTTRFDDWIEKDLLKLSPWDVREVVIDDYSLGAVESGGRMMVEQNRKSLIDVVYDDKDAKWTLSKLESFAAGNKPKEDTLADNEELAAGKLNDLRNALGDLKIIDVTRKPSGLSADLKADEKFSSDLEAVSSLQQRGFLPLKSGEILSTDGESIVGMKDGVEYVLRFGAGTTVATAETKSEDTKTKSDKGKADDTEGETAGRYLLVMARLNEELLPKPALEPLPEAPAEASESKKEPEQTESQKAAVGGVSEDKKEADAEEQESVAVKKEGDQPAAQEASTALKEADESEAKAQAALEQRRLVERENHRKQDEYDEKLKAAQKRVRDLNNRFADWYYVVSDKEYAKIHLDRTSVVQKKEEKPADAPVQ